MLCSAGFLLMFPNAPSCFSVATYLEIFLVTLFLSFIAFSTLEGHLKKIVWDRPVNSVFVTVKRFLYYTTLCSS